MAKSFRYYAKPDEIKEYLVGLGYEIKMVLRSDTKEAIGFDVLDTTVELSYDPVVDGRVVGYGGISMRVSLTDPEETERSQKLYRRLYQRFNRRPKQQKNKAT